MPIPLLAIFAAGLGAQQLVERGARRRETEASVAAVQQQREAVAIAGRLGEISQQQGAIADSVAQQGNAAITNATLRSMIAENRRRLEFGVTSTETAASNRSLREDRDRRFLLNQDRFDLEQDSFDASLNPEIQQALQAARARGTRSAEFDTVVDGATQRTEQVPRRNTPLYITARDGLRDSNRGLRIVNRLHTLISDLPRGEALDPASPVASEITNLYELMLSFGREEQNLGTPQAAEILRQERANPNPTDFIRSLIGSKASILSAMSVTQATFQRGLTQTLRDTRNFDFDREDTDTSMGLLLDAQQQQTITAALVGPDPNVPFGTEEDFDRSRTKGRAAIDLAISGFKASRFPTEERLKRLRLVRLQAERVFGDPDIPIFFPDVLTEDGRKILNAIQGIEVNPFN